MKGPIWPQKMIVFVVAVTLLCLFSGCQQQDTGAMAEAQAKATVSLVLQFWNEGNLDLAEQIYAPDVVRHDYGLKKDFAGLDAQKDLVTQNRTSFPDLRLTIDEMIVMGDTIAMRWTLSGTNNGPIGEIPATGNKVQFPGVSVVHMVNGKAIEIWDVYNQLDIMEQLGFTAAPRKKIEQK